jgi:hypothetical protein
MVLLAPDNLVPARYTVGALLRLGPPRPHDLPALRPVKFTANLTLLDSPMITGPPSREKIAANLIREVLHGHEHRGGLNLQ